jgi:hypothetical protein
MRSGNLITGDISLDVTMAIDTRKHPCAGVFCGAEDQGRTGDLSLFRRALYQLSYLGKSFDKCRMHQPYTNH